MRSEKKQNVKAVFWEAITRHRLVQRATHIVGECVLDVRQSARIYRSESPNDGYSNICAICAKETLGQSQTRIIHRKHSAQRIKLLSLLLFLFSSHLSIGRRRIERDLANFPRHLHVSHPALLYRLGHDVVSW